MSDLFGFLDHIGNYDERRVAQYQDERDERLYISAAAVFDSDDPFETAVAHPRYHDGELIIVETYATKELAEAGHSKWVSKMTAPVLPEELVGVSTCGLADLCVEMGADMRFPIQEES